MPPDKIYRPRLTRTQLELVLQLLSYEQDNLNLPDFPAQLVHQTRAYFSVFTGKIDLELVAGPGPGQQRVGIASSNISATAKAIEVSTPENKKLAAIEQAKMMKEFNPVALAAFLVTHNLTEADI